MASGGRMMRGIVLFVMLVCAGAAAAQSYRPEPAVDSRVPRAETGDYGAVRRIAVVSALGPELRIETYGKRRDVSRTIATPDWNLDSQAEATLRKYLAGRFALVDAVVDGEALRAWLASGMDAADYLKKQAPRGVDAFLIVRPADEPGPAGMGLRIGQAVALCANYEIDVIDAHRWSILGKAASRMQTHTGTPATFACCAEEMTAKAAENPSAAALDALRQQARILIPRSLVETLRALDLGVALPPPGDHSIAPPENPANTDAIATVALVSAIGDTFSFSSLDGLSRANAVVETRIAGWTLDAETERVAAAALARKFKVVPAAFDRAALARIVLREHKRPKIEGLTPSGEVDAYVVIVKTFRDGTASSGAGLWNRGFPAGATYAFVNYAVVLVDARTLEVLKAALPAMNPKSAAAYPLVPVDGALWPDGAKDASAATKARNVIRSLIADSLPETLYQMGLTRD